MSSSQLKVSGGGTQTYRHTSYYIGALPETDTAITRRKNGMFAHKWFWLVRNASCSLPHPE